MHNYGLSCAHEYYPELNWSKLNCNQGKLHMLAQLKPRDDITHGLVYTDCSSWNGLNCNQYKTSHVSATETKRWHHSRSWMLTSAPFSRSQWSTLCAPYNAAWISHSTKYKIHYHHYQFIRPVSLPITCQLSTEYFLKSICHSCHSFEFISSKHNQNEFGLKILCINESIPTDNNRIFFRASNK